MVRVLCLVALVALVLCFIISDSDAVKPRDQDPGAVSDKKGKQQSDKPRKKAGSIRLSKEERKKHPKFRRQSRNKMRSASVIPDCFDARQQWPNCQSIKNIRDQGQCGTCWAVSAASVISDRICIASGQVNQTYVSALHLASCFDADKTGLQRCDDGGNEVNAYRNAAMLGYLTGGDFANVVGCEPYPLITKSIPLNCPVSCTNPKYLPTNPASDIRFHDAYWVYDNDDESDPTVLATIVADMQTEIMTNGPVTAAIEIWSDSEDYSDFEHWTADQGAYRGQAADAVKKTGHAVRIIGWCDDQNGVPYWMIANSWGTVDSGEEGIYWVERGRNVIGIEEWFTGPTIRIAQSCPTSACMTGVDQVIRLDISNMNSPIYAFQGNCTVRVTVDAKTGKMTPVGKPAPIGGVFLSAPPGPIVGYYSESSTQFWLQNPTSSGYCSGASGSTKYGCDFYDEYGGATSQTLLNGITYSYYNDDPTYWYAGNNGKNIGTAITSKYSQVNALLGLSSGKILICGLSTTRSPVCGTIDITGKVVSTPVPIGSSFTQC